MDIIEIRRPVWRIPGGGFGIAEYHFEVDKPYVLAACSLRVRDGSLWDRRIYKLTRELYYEFPVDEVSLRKTNQSIRIIPRLRMESVGVMPW